MAALDYPAQIMAALDAEFQKVRNGRFRVFRGPINWATQALEYGTWVACLVQTEINLRDDRGGINNEMNVVVETFTGIPAESPCNGVNDTDQSDLRDDLKTVMRALNVILRDGQRARLVTDWRGKAQDAFCEPLGVMGQVAELVILY